MYLYAQPRNKAESGIDTIEADLEFNRFNNAVNTR